jgi:hypothetical protein
MAVASIVPTFTLVSSAEKASVTAASNKAVSRKLTWLALLILDLQLLKSVIVYSVIRHFWLHLVRRKKDEAVLILGRSAR